MPNAAVLPDNIHFRHFSDKFTARPFSFTDEITGFLFGSMMLNQWICPDFSNALIPENIEKGFVRI